MGFSLSVQLDGGALKEASTPALVEKGAFRADDASPPTAIKAPTMLEPPMPDHRNRGLASEAFTKFRNNISNSFNTLPTTPLKLRNLTV